MLPGTLAEYYLFYLSCIIPDVLNRVFIRKEQDTVHLCFPPRWQDIVLPLLLSQMARSRLSSTCLENDEITNSRICSLKTKSLCYPSFLMPHFVPQREHKLYPLLRPTKYMCVGWNTALQAGRSRVPSPMVSLKFFSDIILRLHYGPGVDSAYNRNEYQESFLGGKGGRCVGLKNFLCWISSILGASTSWNPLGMPRSISKSKISSNKHKYEI